MQRTQVTTKNHIKVALIESYIAILELIPLARPISDFYENGSVTQLNENKKHQDDEIAKSEVKD